MIGLKISLIIPAYNEEKYIASCLDSIMENSGDKFHEIIVVDNASTDETKKIVSQYRNVKIVHESNKGLTKARQKGYLESTGDIVAYVDADTRMPKNWFNKVENAFLNNKKLVCLSGPYIYHDIPKIQGKLVALYWYLALPIYWVVGYMTVGGNFAIKRFTLDQMNGFDTAIEFYGEDTNIARRASKFGKVHFDINFNMQTSGRRFKGQGLVKTFWIYVTNFASEIFLKRPVTRNYTDIR